MNVKTSITTMILYFRRCFYSEHTIGNRLNNHIRAYYHDNDNVNTH